jgi:hypothetical protein
MRSLSVSIALNSLMDGSSPNARLEKEKWVTRGAEEGATEGTGVEYKTLVSVCSIERI